ncbi:MAG: cbb3-type cytochrome c oxidase subunit II [Chthoniobacterales bacterium]|nr:cbb3-type cytochrome c oxidase subunit II [Chthoniobacterales bacterium]
MPQASESKPNGGNGNGTPSVPAPLEPGGGPSPAPAVAAQTADTVTDPTTTAAGPNNEPLLYSAAWHHRHLYDPRSINPYSIMPSFRFLYEKRRISGQPSADAVNLGGPDVAPDGWEVVPSYDAKALVAYLMSLDQTHALKEVKSSGPVSPPAPGKAVK